MTKQVWKEFEENLLTHSAAHYLMTIHDLVEEHGYARVTDIARKLNITRGSCSISLKPLKKRGLVVEDENKILKLSEEGRLLAEMVEKNDDLLQAFFHDVLGVDPEQAEIDACKIEHLLSIETSLKLAHFIQAVKGRSEKAAGFLAELHENAPACTHDASTCEFCGSVCLEPVAKTPKKRARRGPKTTRSRAVRSA